MPRYRATSPFEQVLLGLSVGAAGVAVFPADGRPDPTPGSTVLLAQGDEIEAPEPIAFPGAAEVDTATPTPTPVTGPATSTEETPKP